MDASRSRDLDGGLIMMEDSVSPTSSRASTPAPEALLAYELEPDMDMVTELSDRFEHHTLASCLPETDDALTPCSSLHIEPPSKRLARSSRSRSSSLLVWQQRQALTRRQCTQAHLSQISALVKELSPKNANGPCYSSTYHPSSSTCSTPLSPTSNPSSPGAAFDSSNPSSSGSEDCCEIEIDTFGSASARPHMTKVGKAQWRRATSVEALERKQKLVLKKVRMRKSLVRLKANV
ncbi:MAG: hypothetical protein LQ352_004628 [Teloschistes flavicans]|nr:MAG: hypothetical protein LQ352_004628 [Teloschistes flavicans]